MGVTDYIWMGILAVFQGPALFTLAGIPIPVTLVMVALGFVIGILVVLLHGLLKPLQILVYQQTFYSTFT